MSQIKRKEHSVKELLEKTRDILNQRGWCRQQDLPEGVTNWTRQTDVPICLGLALFNADDDRSYSATYEEAMELLGQQIDPTATYFNNCLLFDWNDATDRTRADIDRVLEGAIAACPA